MVSAILSRLLNLWPFFVRKTGDDLEVSDGLVRGLQIPDQTKQFVFAIRDPETQAVIYLLAAQNLSEQSSLDTEYLIGEVRPEVVVAQIAPSALFEIQKEENGSRDDDEEIPIPTSSFGVLKRCFINKIQRQQYYNMAGSQVLRDIFGIGFYGHFLTAIRAAEDVDSMFLCLESPFVRTSVGVNSREETEFGTASACLLQPSSLLGEVTPFTSFSANCLCLSDQLQSQMIKALSSSLASSVSKDEKTGSSFSVRGLESGESHPGCDYEAPSFAHSVYPLLTDLHDIFVDLPAIGKALVYAQKMLLDIGRGDSVDTQLLSEVHNFRIAVEGLRIALNNAARSPISKMESRHSRKVEFSELCQEEKGHVLLAQALKSQAKKYRSIVAIVDASSIAGLRKHWNTPVAQEIAELAEQCFTSFENDGEKKVENTDRKRVLAEKPVMVVGAGASAILGVSSLSKFVPTSAFIKLIGYKVPSSLKIVLTQTHRISVCAITKVLGPSKMVLPSITTFGSKTSVLKVIASTEKIRAVAHSIIASVEHTSYQAMRMAFYEIMRRRRRQPIGIMPWTAFGCSVTACAGLLVYGDGLECAAEVAPAAQTIACLGRGLRSLHQASQEVRQTHSTKIQETIKSLMHSLKKMKVQ